MSGIDDQPWEDATAVTPNDATPNVYRALYIGGAGNVKITTSAGTAVTFSGVPAGTILKVLTKLVWATGTTATNIVGRPTAG